MENEEKINFEDETFDDMSDALDVNELSTGYIGNPAVGGEPMTLVIKKVTKLIGKKLIGKDRNGDTFTKNLSNVDFGYEIVSDTDAKYTIPGWEVWGKLKSIFQKNAKQGVPAGQGLKIQITHVLDGMKAENKKLDKYKVEAEVDGVFKTLDRETKEWSN